MRIEDIGVPASELFFGSILDRFELKSGNPDGSTKTFSFAFQITLCNLGAINVARAFLQTEHTTDYNSIRNAKTLAAKFLCGS